MNEWMEILYLHDVKECNGRGVDREKCKREWELYNLLWESFDEKRKEWFRGYVNLKAEQRELEWRAVYEQGFKAVVQLLTDCLK